MPFLSLVVILQVLLLSSVQAIINTDVSQVIDATSSMVRYSADVKISEIEKEYRVIFANKWADHLAFLSVTTSKGKALNVLSPVSNGNYTTWTVDTSSFTPTTSTHQLKIQATFTSLMTPFPAEITQLENQLVLLHTSHLFFSPYLTTTQKLVVKLASSTIESFTKLAPFNVRGSSVHFGPYKDIQPFEVSILTLHFVNHAPFAKFSSMQREVELSHWGNIAVEDVYELQHAGAKLKNGFSRFDYQMRQSPQGMNKHATPNNPSFRNLVAVLPVQAHDIYYRDQIGNISTSDIRVKTNTKEKNLELEIQTRFPLFGGWQTQFYMGFSMPTELSLFHATTEKDEKFHVKVPFFTFFQDVWVENMEVKVILPEGATDIEVKVPYPMEESRTIRYTYLDSQLNGGRPVVTLKTQNLVPEHASDLIEIQYHYPKMKLFVEPFMLVGLYFVLFLLASVFARTTGIVTGNNNNYKKNNSDKKETSVTEN